MKAMRCFKLAPSVNTTLCRFIIACLLVFSICACAHAPLTPRNNAASIGKGKLKLETGMAPTIGFSAMYGLGENLDVGIDFEQLILTSVWSRYSFLNEPQGFSLAANGAVFVAVGENASNGWYTGLLASQRMSERVRLNLGIRYADLDYRINPDGVGFLNPLDFTNTEDASVQTQADLSLSFRFRRHVEFSLGVSCRDLPRNTDPLITDDFCAPLLGFQFYRL